MIISGVVVDVKNILESIDLEIKSETPKELLADCPFCSDGSGNLSINRESGLYHCWRCGAEDRRARGNLVHLVAVVRGLTHPDATEHILQYGTFATSKQLLRRLREAFVSRRHTSRLQSVQGDVDRFFNPRHPYWKERGISRQTAEIFQLGFDERRQHAIMPIMAGDIPVALIRRNTSDFGPRYLYPEGFQKERFLYGLEHAKPEHPLVLVEGPIDALKVSQAGYNGVACLGATFSDFQSRLVLDFGPSYVVLMTDEDLGGQILSTKIWDTYPLRNVYYTEFPSGRKDPGEMTTDEIWEAIALRKHVLGLYLANLQARAST